MNLTDTLTAPLEACSSRERHSPPPSKQAPHLQFGWSKEGQVHDLIRARTWDRAWGHLYGHDVQTEGQVRVDQAQQVGRGAAAEVHTRQRKKSSETGPVPSASGYQLAHVFGNSST